MPEYMKSIVVRGLLGSHKYYEESTIVNSQFALIAFLALFASGCQEQAVESQETSGIMNDQQQVVSLSKKIGIALPNDTEVLFLSDDDSGIDGLVRAKLAMTPEQWKSFVANTPLAKEEFTEQKRYQLGPDGGDWDPQRKRKLPTAQAELADAKVIYAGVDDSDAERTVVYLVWHET